ncbi:MAG: DUF3560 domain-containing protein [Cocleimonas sp.]
MNLFLKATYNPEDNKLRLYLNDERLPDDIYQNIVKAGYKYAPVQQLLVATWSPERQDVCNEYVECIVPDDISLADRATAKVERLDAIAKKRLTEASGFSAAAQRISACIEFGQPILVNHHSERRARKDQKRLESLEVNRQSAFNAADYYCYKAQGVELHVNQKNSERTRLGRIDTLLTDLRSHQRSINHGNFVHDIWTKISAVEDVEKKEKHTRNMSGNRLSDGSMSPDRVWSELDENKITVDEAIERCLAFGKRLASSSYRIRFIQHILNRLAYEHHLLESLCLRFDGKLTAVVIQAFARKHGADSPKSKKVDDGWCLSSVTPLPVHLGDGKSLTLTDDEWRDLMLDLNYEVPLPKPTKPSILNFKANSVAVSKRSSWDSGSETLKQIEMTKAEFARIHSDSRGVRLSACETFRAKVCSDPSFQGAWYSAPKCVVFLTDSKSHPIPDSDSVILDEQVEDLEV